MDQLEDENCGEGHHHGGHHAAYGQHQFGFQAEARSHGKTQALVSAAVPREAASYSLSLLCNVFRLMPRISAARVLLLLVDSSVFKMSRRSASPTVVPIPRRTALGSLAAGAGIACPKPGGKCRVSTIFVPGSHTMMARSSTLRSSRTFPGQLYCWNIFMTSSLTAATSRWCLRPISASRFWTSSAKSSLCSRSGGRLMLKTLRR